MTMGGVVSSLNSTLARLNAIEQNFQALNNVAFELDFKQADTEHIQNSDFKAILDGKVNAVEEKNQEIQKLENEPLVVYEDEIEPKVEQISPEEKNQEIKAISNNTKESTVFDNNNVSTLKEDDIEPVSERIIPNDDVENEPVNLKSKISINPKSENIDEIIETLSKKYNIDSDFVKALVKQESGFNPKATSKKGAMGLMQLMPKTAQSLGVEDAYNPWQNVEGGVKHLKNLLNKYNNNQELALAAYNAGSGAVHKYGGIPPYKETQNYVKSIMSAYTKAKEARI